MVRHLEDLVCLRDWPFFDECGEEEMWELDWAQAKSSIETDGMPMQAPAATAKESAESAATGVAGKAASVVKAAVDAAKTVAVDGEEGGAEDHDEL